MATTEITHALWKHSWWSWWNGSAIGMCGQRYRPGFYGSAWTSQDPITCPGCRAALGTTN